MKRYYNNDNMDQDPSRPMMPIREMAMNNPFLNNKNININNNINNSQLQRVESDIDIKFLSSSKDLLPKNNNNINNPNNIDTITSFNSGMTRLKELTDELFDSNKSLQEYKNREFKLENELKDLKKEVGDSNRNQMEIISLTRKNTELMHEIHKLKSQKTTDDQIIERLKRVLIELKDNDNDNNNDNDNDNNNDNNNEKIKYDNQELRGLLIKYKKLDEKTIDKLFNKFKVTEELEITKELLLKLM